MEQIHSNSSSNSHLNNNNIATYSYSTLYDVENPPPPPQNNHINFHTPPTQANLATSESTQANNTANPSATEYYRTGIASSSIPATKRHFYDSIVLHLGVPIHAGIQGVLTYCLIEYAYTANEEPPIYNFVLSVAMLGTLMNILLCPLHYQFRKAIIMEDKQAKLNQASANLARESMLSNLSKCVITIEEIKTKLTKINKEKKFNEESWLFEDKQWLKLETSINEQKISMDII